VYDVGGALKSFACSRLIANDGGNVVNVCHPFFERRVATRRSTNDVIVDGAIVSGGRRYDQAASRGGISPSVRSALYARISFLHTESAVSL
jgi:hypothetical protein